MKNLLLAICLLFTTISFCQTHMEVTLVNGKIQIINLDEFSHAVVDERTDNTLLLGTKLSNRSTINQRIEITNTLQEIVDASCGQWTTIFVERADYPRNDENRNNRTWAINGNEVVSLERNFVREQCLAKIDDGQIVLYLGDANNVADYNDIYITLSQFLETCSYARSNETVTTLVDNGNGTFTYTNENGVPVTFDASETFTFIQDNGDRTYTYFAEDGSQQVIDASEFVTSLRFILDSDEKVLRYTDELGVNNDVPLAPLQSLMIETNNAANTNTVATHERLDGTTTDIKETVTSLVLESDNTLVYTDENEIVSNLDMLCDVPTSVRDQIIESDAVFIDGSAVNTTVTDCVATITSTWLNDFASSIDTTRQEVVEIQALGTNVFLYSPAVVTNDNEWTYDYNEVPLQFRGAVTNCADLENFDAGVGAPGATVNFYSLTDGTAEFPLCDIFADLYREDDTFINGLRINGEFLVAEKNQMEEEVLDLSQFALNTDLLWENLSGNITNVNNRAVHVIQDSDFADFRVESSGSRFRTDSYGLLFEDPTFGFTGLSMYTGNNSNGFIDYISSHGSALKITADTENPNGIYIAATGEVGILNESPVTALDVNGGIKVANSTVTDDGTIRYNGTTQLFEFRENGAWNNLGSGGGGSSLWTESASDIYFNTGSVGIGNLPVVNRSLFVRSISDYGAGLEVRSTNAIANWARLDITNQNLSSTPFFLFQDQLGNAGIRNAAVSGAFNSYLDGTGDYNWYIGGSAGSNVKMTLQNNGDLGVGTSTPGAKLHVYDDVDSALRLSIDNPNTGASSQSSIALNSGGYTWIPYVRYNNGDQLRFYSNTFGGDLMTLNSNGNVGVGQSNPTEKIHVTATDATLRLDEGITDNYFNLTKVSNNVAQIDNYASTGNSFVDINPRALSGTGNSKVRIGRQASTIGDAGLEILQHNGTSGVNTFLSGNADSYIARFSGNVGIGTITPSQKLDVSQDAPIIRLTDTDSSLSDDEMSSGIEFYQSDSGNVGVGAGIFTEGQGSTGELAMYFTAGSNERIMTVLHEEIGIGTDAPTRPLHISTIGKASDAIMLIESDTGTDAKIEYSVNGTEYWESGIDQSNSNAYVIDQSDFDGTSAFMLQHSTGNVGINVASPEARFHVSSMGFPMASFQLESAGAAALRIRNNSNGWYLESSTGNEFSIRDQDRSFSRFQIENYEAATDDNVKLRIEDTGHVTINNSYSFPLEMGTSGQMLAVPSSGNVLEFVNPSSGSTPLGFGMDFLTEYWQKSFPAANMPSVQAILPQWNTRMVSKRYRGKHDRVYFMYIAQVSTTRQGRIFWYDFDTEDFSSTQYNFGDASSNTDSHNTFSLNIDPDGYLICVASRDDGDVLVWRSQYPELDNSGAIDASYTLQANSVSLTDYSNYAGSAYMNNQLIIDWRGRASGTENQENRMIVSSDDHGVTYNTAVEWLDLDNEHWAYGAIYPDSYRGGVFLSVAVREGSVGGYPKWGIVWTDDLVTFGDMEYYSSNKTSGWSKDVVSFGAITDAEFVTNLAVINDAYNNNENHFLPKLEQTGFGHLVVFSIDGTRPGFTNVTDYVTSIYNIDNNTWTHNEVPLASMPVTVTSSLVPSVALTPYNTTYMRMILEDSSGNAQMIYSDDGGVSWTFEKTLVNTGSVNFVAESNHMHGDKEEFVIIQNGTADLQIVRFGESTARDPYRGTVRSEAEVFDGRSIAFTEDDQGVIMTAPNGTCFRISVDNSGLLSTVSVTCPN